MKSVGLSQFFSELGKIYGKNLEVQPKTST